MRISSLSRKKKSIALVISTILICAAGGAAYIRTHQESTAVISLAYQDASRGLYPDGTRIDAYLATSEDVLGAAEEALGYKIPRESIWVRPSYTGKGATYATDYTITYDGAHGDEVLSAVVNAWENAFFAHTGTNRSVIAYESYPADMDYLDIASWLEKEAGQIRYAANQRLKENKAWTPKDNSMSYADIVSAADNLQNVTIANLRTYIVQNGISKDPETLANTIAYRNRELQKRKAMADAQYHNRLKAIALYDSTLFPTISVPSISSGTYYVTTTKTGLDYIYESAQEFLDASLSIQKTITENNLLLANSVTNPSEKQINELTSMVQSIEKQIRDLAEKTTETDQLYEKEQMKPWYSIRIDGVSYSTEEVGNFYE